MRTTKAFLTGTALGAGAMYFFDPRMGNRRRALLEDQFHHLWRQAECGCDAGVRDLGNRAQGLLHNMGALVQHGEWPQARQRSGGGQFRWSPAMRLIAATCGAALLANCVARRTLGAKLLGAAGLGLFAKSLDAGDGEVHIQRTLEIDAPVDRVYEFFSHPENYPRISDVITNVEIFGHGHFAKDMLVAGIPVRFEERFFRCEKNRALESRSEPGSLISYCKQMTFEKAGENHTRLHVTFNYHPPGGAVGHAVASIVGIDPKTLLSDLLMRAKFYLETDREPHDAAAHRRRNTPRSAPATVSRNNGGEERDGGHTTLHGPAAPTDDVLRPGIREMGHPSTWPASPSPMPQPAELAGRFPPAV
jgi:uncharacterized membrane protein